MPPCVAGLQQQGDPYLGFNPDALGQPRKIGSYASGITHHPNGAVAGYTLGNGVVFSQSLNARGLPWVRREVRTLDVTWDTTTWDANGNVASITDNLTGQTSQNTRVMGYDGLDRLTSTSGPWGAASFGYDAADNLSTSTVGARTLSHNLDGNNRLGSLSGSQSVSFGYDANGNITTRGAQGFVFDIGNRLSSATGKAGSTREPRQFGDHAQAARLKCACGKRRSLKTCRAGRPPRPRTAPRPPGTAPAWTTRRRGTASAPRPASG